MHADDHESIEIGEPLFGFVAGFWLCSVLLAVFDLLFFQGQAPLPVVLGISALGGLVAAWTVHASLRDGKWHRPWQSSGGPRRGH
jgi:hypothetical protein